MTIIVAKTNEEVIGADESRSVKYSMPYTVIDEVVPEAMSFDMIKWWQLKGFCFYFAGFIISLCIVDVEVLNVDFCDATG